MGVLDQLMQMRNQGLADQDIISQLQEQGATPKAINDAFNQANIKNAVGEVEKASQRTEYGDDYTPVPQPAQNYVPKTEEYAGEDFYLPQGEQSQAYQYQSAPAPLPAQNYQEFYPQEQGYGQGNYAEGGTDTDMMIEIAQQVFLEKMKKTQQQIDDLNEFRTLYQTKVDSMYERLKRMENIIDNLQSAILEKIGSYGSGIESVKKELSMMQDTYGKIVGAVAEKHHARHEASASAHLAQPASHKIHHAKKNSKKSTGKKK